MSPLKWSSRRRKSTINLHSCCTLLFRIIENSCHFHILLINTMNTIQGALTSGSVSRRGFRSSVCVDAAAETGGVEDWPVEVSIPPPSCWLFDEVPWWPICWLTSSSTLCPWYHPEELVEGPDCGRLCDIDRSCVGPDSKSNADESSPWWPTWCWSEDRICLCCTFSLLFPI